MAIDKTNWVTLTVAFCFVILQALQPFIHAHLEDGHPIQNTGLHVGADHEEVFQAHAVQPEHTVYFVPHAPHTVSVESSIKQEQDSLFAANSALILVALCLAIILHLSTQAYFYFSRSPYPSLKRRLPASRAPPHY